MARFRKYIMPFSFRRLYKKPQFEENIGKFDLEAIQAYVKASVIPVREGRKCVDGRYLPDQGTGMIARPGGDCGYVMALDALNSRKKLGLTPEECFNFVYKAIIKSGGKFAMHTDDHAFKGNIGCGHLSKASNKKHSKEYDMKCDDVQHIINYACNLSEISSEMEMVELHGGHEEKGVLIIQSDKYTILPDNPELHQMYFVYDEERDDAFLKKLVQEMKIGGIEYEEMKAESNRQLQATLHNLALGLPIYNVTFNGNQPEVTQMGFVSQKSQRVRMRMRLQTYLSSQQFLNVFHRDN